MPRREDERNYNRSGKHPVYCTCADCVARGLKRRKVKPGRGVAAEKVKRHPRDCRCSTCQLLSSVGDLPEPPRRKKGLLGRLFGRG